MTADSGLKTADHSDYDQFILIQHILDSSKESFVLINRDFQVTLMNRFAKEISLIAFGRELEENSPVMDFILPERKELFLGLIEKVFAGETQYSEVVYPSKDKKADIILEMSYTPVFGANGYVANALIQASNVTRRKKLEEEIEQQRAASRRNITRASYQAQEKERSFLGKELHDNINQILTATLLSLDMAENSEAVRAACIQRSKSYISQAIDEIRKLSRGLVVSDMIKNGVFTAMQELTAEYMSGRDIQVKLEKEGFNEDLICVEMKMNLYRILQEQLSNIIKHARASLAEIKLSYRSGIVHLNISDNGVGYNVECSRKGIGITNIFNRAESLGGNCVITSEPGRGCSVSVSIPI